ncbi:MAG: hypothetical protein AAGB04_10495 [Pseudomonadota bacterium]
MALALVTAQSASAQGVQIARQTQDASQVSRASDERRNCGQQYHASLSTVKETAGSRLIDAARSVRRGRPGLPGYWMFWNPGRAAIRKKLARIGNPANAIVIEDRMCARSVLGRGGRIRCLKWVPKPKNYRPQTEAQTETEWSEPAAGKDQRDLLRRLTTLVRSRGAIQELRRSGRLFELTRRVGGELMGYLDQAPRPTICTGAQAMLDFYERQLRPLEAQFGDSDELIKVARELALRLSTDAHAAWSKAASNSGDDAMQDRASLPSNQSHNLPAAWQSASRRDLVRLNAGIMLPRRHVGYIAAEKTLFDRLVRAREAMSSSSASEAAPHVRSAVFRAFRALEVTYYADLRKDQIETYRTALFGVIDAIRKRHTDICTCSP